MVRNTEKKLLQSLSMFESLAEMVSKACDPDSPTLVKSLAKNRDKLDQAYQDLYHDFKVFKEDVNDLKFNDKDEDGADVYVHNDSWLKTVKEEYFDLVEKSDERLENLQGQGNISQEPKVDTNLEAEIKTAQEVKVKKLFESQFKSEKKAIHESVTLISNTVSNLQDASISSAQAQGYRNSLLDISTRIDVRLQKLVEDLIKVSDDAEVVTIQEEMSDFTSMERARVASLEMCLVTKIKEAAASTVRGSGQSSSSHTYLKKQDPPKFLGDILEFPEFQRRWNSQVHSEKLEEQAELDRLRDNIPDAAKKMLTGEKSLENAWKILTKLYGNKTMLANKLKAKLKNIKISGREDYDIVINLAIEVKGIVKSLTEMKMQEMLKYDDEYLSAIFRILPAQHRTKWLEYDKMKHTSTWEAMEAFLDDAHEKATDTKVLLSNYAANNSPTEGIRCKKCQGFGHKKNDCPKNSVSTAATKVNNDSDSDDTTEKKLIAEKEKLKNLFGKCPLCKSRHSYKRMKDGGIWPSDRFSSCEIFRQKSESERADVLEKNTSCSRCLSWLHAKDSRECKAPKASCGYNKGGGVKCKGDHSRMVCGSGNAYCATIQFSGPVQNSSSDTDSSNSECPDIAVDTMMLLEDIEVKSGDVVSLGRTLWDGGSNRGLVRIAYAKKMQFRSHKVSYKLSAVGSSENVQDGVVYEFEVVDRSGQVYNVWGFGVEEIIDSPDAVNLKPVRHLFPHVPDDVFDELPKKPIDLLIGLNFFSLHPDGGQGINSAGNLRVLHSKFAKGWLVAGSHPYLQFSSPNFSTSALSIARVCRVDVKPEFSIKSNINFKPQYSRNFWESENMGVLPPKRCCRCMTCPDCKDAALIHSQKEQDELELLQKSIKLENGQLVVNYPFIKSPECFPNNRDSAVAMSIKQEARLKKKGILGKYNEELYKYITRGILVPISEQEKIEYQGPVNYISHHAVEKPSPTTPFRIVTNSSLKNGLRSLNDCLPKGPNSLNSMFDIMVRFRCHPVGLVFDLSKAYNSLHTGLVEKHLRRLIWRFSEDEPWQDFGFVVVAFGDKPAGEFLELGKALTADAGKSIDPVASKRIKNDSYVDDHITGGTLAEVRRMMGNRLGDGSYDGTVCKIFEKGNLKVKVMVPSWEVDNTAKDMLGNKVLGYCWDATTDQMAVVLSVNTSGRVRKMKPKPDITTENLDLLTSSKFSKKICLSVANGFVDFMGIGCPFLLRFKLLMKDIFEDKKITSWTDEIDEEAKKVWVDLIKEAVFSGYLIFPRCSRPANAIGGPYLVSFPDGSFVAFAAAVYLRWELPCTHPNPAVCEGDFSAQIMCAKSRVTPLSGLTIPRSELSGMVLSSRLTLTVAKALSCEESMHPTGSVTLSDSECSIYALAKTSSALKPYFHNRVSEIKENTRALAQICDVEDVHHIPREFNVADIATHPGVSLSALGPDSLWQKGPSFLASRRDLWPVSRDFVKKTEVPDAELRTKRTNLYAACRVVCSSVIQSSSKSGPKLPDLWNAITSTMNYSNSLSKVLNILSRLIRAWKLGKTMEVVKDDPKANELAIAENLVLLSAMPDTNSAYMEGKLDSLMPKKQGALIVTTGRLGEQSLTGLLGVSSLPILLPSTRAAYLYMVREHCGKNDLVHKSAVETLARTRSFVWIVRGKNLAKSVVKNCPMCIKTRKELAGQQMAKFKPENVQICKPWTYVSLDFAGPVTCKGVVNGRARRKCWILVYVCRSTKAVCLLATAGYDTAHFLLRHEEFVARKAAPKEIISDQGSQLIAASDIIMKKQSPESWDWKSVEKKNSSTEWKFVPAGSQHHNGLPEAMVKALKKSLSQTLHPGVILTYDELVTLLARITSAINSRPLGLSSTSNSDQQEDNLLPLTPNHMLLGRSSPETPPMEYSESDKFCQRVAFVAAVEKEWWDRWVKFVLPTMFPLRKWKKEKDNLIVGDVVMLTFPGKVKDSFTLARVTEVHPDDNNLVRRVTVKFRRKNSKEDPNVCKSKMEEKIVAVQRLVLVVPAPRLSTSPASPGTAPPSPPVTSSSPPSTSSSTSSPPHSSAPIISSSTSDTSIVSSV